MSYAKRWTLPESLPEQVGDVVSRRRLEPLGTRLSTSLREPIEPSLMSPGGKRRSLTLHPEPLVEATDHVAQPVIGKSERTGDLRTRCAAHK